MRIISGKYRGKRIDAPASLPSRPTTDFAKEGLFNILNNWVDFEECTVLDLFAGTGNISYEFASRGAHLVYAVDESYECIKFIQKTVEKSNFNAIKAYKSDVFQFLKRDSQKYDLIFADPPFAFEEYEKLINTIFELETLKEDGIFILEHEAKKSFLNTPGYFEERKYGGIKFSFFRTPKK